MFFSFGTLSAAFLAVVLLREAVDRGWSEAWFVLFVYFVIAYLVLPRLHTALSAVYLPDYFIGRTRTREGILGDPVNIALLGQENQIHATMVAAGWTRADALGVRANLRIALSTLTRRSYPTAPVSELYLFGRRQHFCYQQEVNGSPGKRHHVRFWPTPEGWLLPGGYRADWLAAGTYDRSVGFSIFTWQITHRIADDIDVERDFIVASMEDVGARNHVIKRFSTGYHSRNGGGDAIVTDGDLPVVDLRAISNDMPDGSLPARSRRTARPWDTTLGTVLMTVRAVAAVLAVIVLVQGSNSWLSGLVETATRGESEGISIWVRLVALIVVTVGAALYGVLAFFVHRGSNAARVIAMTSSALAITAIASSWWTQPTTITLQTNLPGLALDICVLLALSGKEARLWARTFSARRLPARQGRAA